MIAQCFDYYRPETLSQVEAALKRSAGKCRLFYGGGSEILTMARVGSIAPQAVIDVKAVPELRLHKIDGGQLVLGAALTLAEIAQKNLFPLMSTTVGRIADHTNQCRITLGGNVAGSIAYREAALPLMLADATVTFWKDGQTREAPIREAFDQRIKRSPEELIVSFSVPKDNLQLPYVHVKRTSGEKIGYPLVTLAAVRKGETLRVALSGVLAYPLRTEKLDGIMSKKQVSAADRAREMMAGLPETVMQDSMASAQYRAYQAMQVIEAAIRRLEGEMG